MKTPNKNSPQAKKSFSWIWILIIAFAIFFFASSAKPPDQSQEIPLNEFRQMAESGKFSEITVESLTPPDGNYQIVGTAKSGGEKYKTYALKDIGWLSNLKTGAKVFNKVGKTSWFGSYFIFLLLPAVIVITTIYLIRSQQKMMGGGGGGPLAFINKTGRRAEDTKKTFADVAGCEEAKEEISDIVSYLKDPAKFSRLGGKISKGILLVGPPGCGKTLFAKAVAGEAGVPFFYASGSDFVEMFVGVGASRVRNLFDKAKQNQPSILFIDELDAIGRYRGAGIGGGHDEREQTLNQILVEIDGFEDCPGVIIMAATNRPDILDPALLRAGRFNRQIVIGRPDVDGRKAILFVHFKNKPVAGNIDFDFIARSTSGFTGSDLENLANEAALLAAKKGKAAIEQEDVMASLKKIIMGLERKLKINPEEKRAIACHEAGHALLAEMLNKMYPDLVEPLYEVSTIPRGQALGLTVQMPTEDKYLAWKNALINRVRILYGGRMAELLVFGKISTGAKNDLDVATDLARRMVCEWGMSDNPNLGWVTLGINREEVFLGKQIGRDRNFSEVTQREIDDEIKSMLMKFPAKAWKILEKNKEALVKLSGALLEKQFLTGKEFSALVLQYVASENFDKEIYKAAKNEKAAPWLRY